MDKPSDAQSPRRRPFSLLLGAVFSLLIGLFALLLAGFGFTGKGGENNVASALPNLITGLASIAGAAGYLALKKWAVPVYFIAVLGHFISHGLLLHSHLATGRVSAGGVFFLMIVPALALAVLVNMFRQTKNRLLS